MREPASSFDDHLAREIIQSERMRMAMLAALVGALLVMQFGFLLLFRDDYQRYFTSPSGVPRVFTVLGLLVIYELTVRHMVGRRAADGRGIPEALRFVNAFVETSVPSILIVLIARDTNPVTVLQSAAVLLYGVFIVLSALRLDFWLSAFTGAVAAVEYVGLSIAYTGSGGAAFAGTPFESPPFYLLNGGMLLLADLAAGFVALQLKRRVGNAWRALQERQRLLDVFGQQVSPGNRR